MPMRKPLFLLALAALAACDDRTRPAMGDEHSVIIVAHDTLWAQVEDTVLAALQPRIFAVREEAAFRVSHESPASPYWADLRRFRQIVAIGRPDDPWVAEPLRRAGAEADAGLDGVVAASSVWARNQRVLAVVVPGTGEAEAVVARIDTVAALLDRRYREWTRERMFTSGLNTELTRVLAEHGDFTLHLPNVYRWRQVSDSAFLFINDQPDASQLVRSLLVTWRSGTGDEPAAGEILDWRQAVADRYYDWGQETQREPVQVRPLLAPSGGATEARGVWHGTIEGFPQAGLFISRAIDCPAQDRRYLLDAWLYAPARAKYQYIIQLETILGSFRCPAV
jgi:hypothetical protein